MGRSDVGQLRDSSIASSRLSRTVSPLAQTESWNEYTGWSPSQFSMRVKWWWEINLWWCATWDLGLLLTAAASWTSWLIQPPWIGTSFPVSSDLFLWPSKLWTKYNHLYKAFSKFSRNPVLIFFLLKAVFPTRLIASSGLEAYPSHLLSLMRPWS